MYRKNYNRHSSKQEESCQTPSAWHLIDSHALGTEPAYLFTTTASCESCGASHVIVNTRGTAPVQRSGRCSSRLSTWNRTYAAVCARPRDDPYWLLSTSILYTKPNLVQCENCWFLLNFIFSNSFCFRKVCKTIANSNLPNEEEYRVVSSNGRKFLYISKGRDLISLLVKYYGPLAYIIKVVHLLNFKSAINLQYFLIETVDSIVAFHILY